MPQIRAPENYNLLSQMLRAMGSDTGGYLSDLLLGSTPEESVSDLMFPTGMVRQARKKVVDFVAKQRPSTSWGTAGSYFEEAYKPTKEPRPKWKLGDDFRSKGVVDTTEVIKGGKGGFVDASKDMSITKEGIERLQKRLSKFLEQYHKTKTGKIRNSPMKNISERGQKFRNKPKPKNMTELEEINWRLENEEMTIREANELLNRKMSLGF